MWYVDLQSQTPITMSPTIQQSILGTIPEINNVYELGKKEDIITFLSQVMWNPVTQTWIKAIHSNFFATWPGLTADLVQKHLKENIETSRGHMQSNRANFRSTKLLSNQECYEMTTTEVRHHEFLSKQQNFPVRSTVTRQVVSLCHQAREKGMLWSSTTTTTTPSSPSH